MKEKKEPLKLKLSTAIILIILLLAIIFGLFYYYYTKKPLINKSNTIEKENIVEENNVNTTISNNTISNSTTPQTQNLDVNSDFVQKLYHHILKYSDYEETLVYQSQKVTSETISNQLKLMTIFDNLTASEADEVTHKTEYGMDITHTLYKKETIERKAQEIFGNSSSIIHESCPIHFTQAIDYKDGIYDRYSYQGGGQTPWDSSVSKLKSAEQKGDEIFLYDQYLHVYDEVGETTSKEGIYTASDRKTKISNLITISLTNKDQREEEAFSQYEANLGNKIQTFKHTFKKNVDGTYYWFSTEPI